MNTDEYEGHTPGPWKVVAKANDYRTTDVVVGKTIVATNISGNDSSLIAAAPNLLAEVKRLRGLLKANECMETCHVGVPCPHGKSCDHIGAGRLTPQELEYEYEYYLRWYCRLREHIGETKWIDLYQEMCKGDDE